MKVLFGFQDALDVVTKGIEELTANAIEAQCKTYLEDESAKPSTPSIKV